MMSWLDRGRPMTASPLGWRCFQLGLFLLPSTALLGAQCDDGDACTLLDSCNDLAACAPGDPPDCDDGNPCTIDSCDIEQGCINLTTTDGCSDGDACTESDQCIDGACVGVDVTCDDDNPCTQDTCDDQGACDFVPDDAGLCDDGSACTEGDACVAGTCTPGPIDACDDDNPCTDDDCVAGACSSVVLDGAGCVFEMQQFFANLISES